MCDRRVRLRFRKKEAGLRGALRKEVRLSYIRLSASYIASQLYLD